MNPNSENTLKTYLQNPRRIRIITPVLLAVAVLSLVVSQILFKAEISPSSAIEFYPGEDSMKSKAVYVDVNGVSDYVASRDSERWYVIIDPYGYGYIAKLNTDQFFALADHNEWWNSDEEYDIAPTRIYGIATKIPDELADVVRDAFDYDTRDDVYDVFGKYYINCTRSRYDILASILLIAGLLSGLGFLLMLLSLGTHSGTVKRCLKKLETLGLTDEAAAQLDSPLNEVIGEDVTRISQDFVFNRTSGTVIPINEIIWLYGHVQRYNGAITSQTLQAATRDNKNYSICEVGKKNGVSMDTFPQIMEILQSRIPDILLGYSLENQNEYNRLCKEYKESNKS